MSKTVLILGAGAVGVSCGLHALRRGHRVVVLDPRGFGEAASHGNAGVIANSECIPVGTPGVLAAVPSMLLRQDSPLRIRPKYLPFIAPWLVRFVAASSARRVDSAAAALAKMLRDAGRAHQELAAAAGIANRILQTGWLKVFDTDKGYEAARPYFDLRRRLGVSCEYLSGAAIYEREPALGTRFRHGILHPDCKQIEQPGSYVKALGDHYLKEGGRFIRAGATSISRLPDRRARVATGTSFIDCDSVVIATGAWSKQLSQLTGLTVPLDTERGYHAEFAMDPGRHLNSPVYWGERSAVMSPSDGVIRLTNSVEFAGLNAPPDYAGLRRVVNQFRHSFPFLANAPVSAEWLGFRSSIPDSMPVIGRRSGQPEIIYAFGHGHLGLTCGPITGKVVGELIDGDPPSVDIGAFTPERFE